MTSSPQELAKGQLDVGTMVHDWEAAEVFWADTVGPPYTKFEKLGGGVRQYRFDAGGSVIKVNHSREPLDPGPTTYRRLRLASAGVSEPRLVRDPEGVEVELVPPGHDGIAGVEMEAGRFSLGDTARVSFVRDPDGGYLEVSERAESTGRPISR